MWSSLLITAFLPVTCNQFWGSLMDPLLTSLLPVPNSHLLFWMVCQMAMIPGTLTTTCVVVSLSKLPDQLPAGPFHWVDTQPLSFQKLWTNITCFVCHHQFAKQYYWKRHELTPFSIFTERVLYICLLWNLFNEPISVMAIITQTGAASPRPGRVKTTWSRVRTLSPWVGFA